MYIRELLLLDNNNKIQNGTTLTWFRDRLEGQTGTLL